MILEADIHDRLRAVAAGTLDVWDFGEWIADQSWNMHKDSTPAAMGLASDALTLFAEYDHHGDDGVLRRELVNLVGETA